MKRGSELFVAAVAATAAHGAPEAWPTAHTAPKPEHAHFRHPKSTRTNPPEGYRIVFLVVFLVVVDKIVEASETSRIESAPILPIAVLVRRIRTLAKPRGSAGRAQSTSYFN